MRQHRCHSTCVCSRATMQLDAVDCIVTRHTQRLAGAESPALCATIDVKSVEGMIGDIIPNDWAGASSTVSESLRCQD